MDRELIEDACRPDDLVDLHRRHIDRIDRTIVALLVERMRLGHALGEIKQAHDRPLRSSARETEVMARVRQAAAGDLTPDAAARIFTAIIAETAAVQADAAGARSNSTGAPSSAPVTARTFARGADSAA
jgi:chorismate mutase